MLTCRLLLLAALAILAGCASQVPIAKNYPLTNQYKVKASHHWDVLANDVADRTVAALAGDPVLRERGVHVSPPPEETAFNRAFSNFLITQLFNKRLPIKDQSDAAVDVAYEIQLVTHGSSRYAHLPGTHTALSGGIWVIRDIIDAGSSAMPGAIALAGLVDFGLGHYAGGATPTELIVTTTITSDGEMIGRMNDIYYVENADLPLFVEPDLPAPTFVARPVKRMEVVGR